MVQFKRGYAAAKRLGYIARDGLVTCLVTWAGLWKWRVFSGRGVLRLEFAARGLTASSLTAAVSASCGPDSVGDVSSAAGLVRFERFWKRQSCAPGHEKVRGKRNPGPTALNYRLSCSFSNAPERDPDFSSARVELTTCHEIASRPVTRQHFHPR